jgi:hypothetical protein
LEYCWLKTKDPLKRLVIVAFLLSEHRINEDWHERLVDLAKRFENLEREARLSEIQGVFINKKKIAKILSEKIAPSKEADSYIQTLKKTAGGE